MAMEPPVPERANVHVVGVISDTHGLLRPEAVAALQGSELILHAGDIGDKQVIRGLEAIAPVRVVRGNTDTADWSRTLPATDIVEVGGVRVHMLHDVQALALDPSKEGFAVVVAGHSHRPGQNRRRGVLFFNPGSAGPRRFRLPVTVGRLVVRGRDVEAEVIVLAP